MKVPKEEAGLWNWGSGSKPKLNRESGGGSGSNSGNVRKNSDEDARCERRPSRSYRRPSNERCERDQREQRDQRDHRERDNSTRRENKEPSVPRKEQHASSTNSPNNRERDNRGSDIIKNKSSKTMRYNPGPLTRNPYLNFMREFRKHNTGENILDITKQGAKAWQSLPIKDKEEFANQARRVPPKSFRRKKKHIRRRFY